MASGHQPGDREGVRTMEARKQQELEKIQQNPEDTALVIEIMAGSLAWAVKKGLEHGEDFSEIVRKFVARNI